MTRLSLATFDRAVAARRPMYEPDRLKVGVAHIGVGAFHRAHQAVLTDDAIETAGGDWGIVGLSLRRPDAAAALAWTRSPATAPPSFASGSIR